MRRFAYYLMQGLSAFIFPVIGDVALNQYFGTLGPVLFPELSSETQRGSKEIIGASVIGEVGRKGTYG